MPPLRQHGFYTRIQHLLFFPVNTMLMSLPYTNLNVQNSHISFLVLTKTLVFSIKNTFFQICANHFEWKIIFILGQSCNERINTGLKKVGKWVSEKNEVECPREQNIKTFWKQLGRQDCYCLCSTVTPATCNRKKLKTGQQDGEIRLKTTWGKKYVCGKVKKAWKYPLISHNAKKQSSGSI